MDFRDVKEAGTTEANNYQVDLDAEEKARMTPSLILSLSQWMDPNATNQNEDF